MADLPKVKKINGKYIYIIFSAIVLSLVVLSSVDLGIKPKFNNFGFDEVTKDTPAEAPAFLQKISYASINNEDETAKNNLNKIYNEIQKIPHTPDIKPQPEVEIEVEIKETRSPYISPPKTGRLVNIPKVATKTTGQNDAWTKNNSPSTWDYSDYKGNTEKNSTPGNSNYQKMLAKLDNSTINAEAMLNSMTGGVGNRDDRHKKFLTNAGKNKDLVLNQQIVKPISPYTLKAGSYIPITMVSGINSELPGQIEAQVRGEVYDSVTQNHLIIPHGTKFVGDYNSGVVFGEKRVLFAWTRMDFPDGSTIALEGMTGADLEGYAGIKGSVDYHYMQLTGAVLMSAFLAVGTEKVGGGGIFGRQMAEDVNSSGQKIVSRQLDVKPTLKVSPGTPCIIKVNKDIILKPYSYRG